MGLREGKQRRIDVKLGEQPAAALFLRGRARHDLAGVEVRDLERTARSSLGLPAELRGRRVTDVEPGSAAGSVGLRAGGRDRGGQPSEYTEEQGTTRCIGARR